MWQREMAAKLGVPFEGKSAPGGRANNREFHGETAPTRFKRVVGDGNCLFRALSFWVTGGEHQHRAVRQAVVDVGRSAQNMRQDREWGGTDELFAAADVMGVDVLVWT